MLHSQTNASTPQKIWKLGHLAHHNANSSVEGKKNAAKTSDPKTLFNRHTREHKISSKNYNLKKYVHHRDHTHSAT
jgi:hypothetical protein